MQPETRFKIKALKELRSIPFVWVVKIQQVAIRGIPDLLICAGGTFVAIELKSRGKTATPHQAYTLDSIERAWGYAMVSTPQNWPDVLRAVRAIAKESALRHSKRRSYARRG